MSEGEKEALVREWLERAREDLAAADRALDPPQLVRTALYHYQQAAEKALKAYLAWRDQPLRRTHQLQELVRDCEQLSADFAALHNAAAVLTPYAERTRYPGTGRDYTADDVDEARRLGREVVAFVLVRLPADVQS